MQKEVYISTELFWEQQQYMVAVAARAGFLDDGLTGLNLAVLGAGNGLSCSWLNVSHPYFSLPNGRVSDLLILL